MKTNSRKNALCHPVFTVITRIALCAICLLGTLFAARATNTLFVKRPNIPILLERHDNVLLQMRLDASEGQTLNEISLNLNEELPLREIKSVKLYYAGTEAYLSPYTRQDACRESQLFHPQGGNRSCKPSNDLHCRAKTISRTELFLD